QTASPRIHCASSRVAAHSNLCRATHDEAADHCARAPARSMCLGAGAGQIPAPQRATLIPTAGTALAQEVRLTAAPPVLCIGREPATKYDRQFVRHVHCAAGQLPNTAPKPYHGTF